VRGLSFVLVASCAFAAGPGGPVPGYILDSRTSVIRPVLGIPGAMQLGAPLSPGFNVTSAEFGPAGDFALAMDDRTPAHLYLVQQLSSTPAASDLGALANDARVLAINSSGSAGMVYSASTSQIWFATGLPQQPVLSAPISTANLAGPITAAALDDAGACAIAGTGALETICSDGTSRRILETGLNVASIALSLNGQDAIVADQAATQVLFIPNYAQSSASTVIAAASDGLNTPAAVRAISATRILVADNAASKLFSIDTSGAQTVQSIDLNIAPTQLRPLADRGILLLNDAATLPFTIMDLSQMQTFFIPAN
jgi:hypothetical protein